MKTIEKIIYLIESTWFVITGYLLYLIITTPPLKALSVLGWIILYLPYSIFVMGLARIMWLKSLSKEEAEG
jgi:hypothetical protein